MIESAMKQLILMRHGHADMGAEGQNDFERTLNTSGQSASKDAGDWIVAHGPQPDVVLFSAAHRTTETWDIVRKSFSATPDEHASEDLYLASPGTLLANIEKLDDDFQTALVIGHNPGLESLTRLMAGPGSDQDAANSLMLGFPAAGRAVIALNGEHWRTMSAEGGKLTAFVSST